MRTPKLPIIIAIALATALLGHTAWRLHQDSQTHLRERLRILHHHLRMAEVVLSAAETHDTPRSRYEALFHLDAFNQHSIRLAQWADCPEPRWRLNTIETADVGELQTLGIAVEKVAGEIEQLWSHRVITKESVRERCLRIERIIGAER